MLQHHSIHGAILISRNRSWNSKARIYRAPDPKSPPKETRSTGHEHGLTIHSKIQGSRVLRANQASRVGGSGEPSFAGRRCRRRVQDKELGRRCSGCRRSTWYHSDSPIQMQRDQSRLCERRETRLPSQEGRLRKLWSCYLETLWVDLSEAWREKK